MNSKYSELKALKQGQKYTVVGLNSFGFPYQIHITFERVEAFERITKFIYKKKRGRRLMGKTLYNESFMVFQGWVEVDTQIYKEKHSDSMISYACFDDRYMQEAEKSAKNPPIFKFT